jgi:hypothetical protein
MSPAFLDSVRLQRGAEHLHSLGARALAEMLAELARDRCDLADTLDRLDAWRDGLTPELLRAAGGNRFPPRPLHVVAA